MATNFNLELDTTAPADESLVLAGGAAATPTQAISAALTTSDGDTTGYMMKVWGDLDGGPATEGAASWVSYNAAPSLTLSTGDGTKTVSAKIRDDVGNESPIASDTITLDTAAPVPNITAGPSAATVSRIPTFDTSSIDWESSAAFEEYKIKVVPNAASTHTEGTQIPTTAGSANVAGAAGGYPALTDITTTIKGADLETASAGDGSKIVKVFVRDDAGNWSV